MQLLDNLAGLSFDQAQDAIVAEFDSLGDVFGQYTYLVEISALLPALTDEEKERCTLVDKCQSQVWIKAEAADDSGAGDSGAASDSSQNANAPRLSLTMESDTFIIRGVLLLMHALFNGRTLEEVEGAHIDFVERTELRDAFSDERLNGFQAIERTIKALAREALEPGAASESDGSPAPHEIAQA